MNERHVNCHTYFRANVHFYIWGGGQRRGSEAEYIKATLRFSEKNKFLSFRKAQELVSTDLF